MSGFLLVDKPPGPTSHDVVQRVRQWSGTRRVGHLGTLDPAAEGLLVLAIGQALKVVPWMEGFEKEYHARLRLGVVTDTQDTTGTILSRGELGGIDEDRVRRACAAFVGERDQVPPMYSALKVGGRKLVDLARAGREIARGSRRIVVRDWVVERVELPEVWFRVRVSKGTYVRTLCHDAGSALGCGGALSWLRRVRVGPFAVEDAHRLDALPPWPGGQRPILEGLGHLPRVALTDAQTDDIRHGRIGGPVEAPPGEAALLDSGGRLVGIGAVLPDGRLRPVRVLPADPAD